MRFMVIVKGNEKTESGALPDPQIVAEMSRFNEELVKAGIMLAGEGLHPSSKGARVTFNKDKRIVTDGPFTETRELVAGYWIWQARSLQEAIDWAKRCPNPTGDAGQLEIRQIMEMEDFTPEYDELIAKEKQLREQIKKQGAGKNPPATGKR